MNSLVKLLHIAIIASLLFRSLTSPVMACDYDASAINEAEREALITALDELGLSLDSPEVQDMDNGELWRYIETMTVIQLENTPVKPHSENEPEKLTNY